MKRLIGLISVGLLVGLLGFGLSLAAAQEVTLSRGQTFKVHVNVYKPAGISFPSDGAALYAFLYEPSTPSWTIYTSGWQQNIIPLYWGSDERQDNFSLTVSVAEDAPAGETLYLRVRLRLDDDPIWEGSGVVVTMTAVEVNGEKIELSVESICSGVFSTGEQGTPYWNSMFNYYAVDAAITDVLITTAGAEVPLTWVIVGIVVLVILIIVIAVVARRGGVAGGPPPVTHEMER